MGIAAALQFHTGERGTLFLGLNYAAGLAIDVKQVVGKTKASIERKFADGDARGCMDVGISNMADMPTG